MWEDADLPQQWNHIRNCPAVGVTTWLRSRWSIVIFQNPFVFCASRISEFRGDEVRLALLCFSNFGGKPSRHTVFFSFSVLSGRGSSHSFRLAFPTITTLTQVRESMWDLSLAECVCSGTGEMLLDGFGDPSSGPLWDRTEIKLQWSPNLRKPLLWQVDLGDALVSLELVSVWSQCSGIPQSWIVSFSQMQSPWQMALGSSGEGRERVSE